MPRTTCSRSPVPTAGGRRPARGRPGRRPPCPGSASSPRRRRPGTAAPPTATSAPRTVRPAPPGRTPPPVTGPAARGSRHRWSGPRPRPRPVRVRVPPSAVPATRGGLRGRTGRACGSSSGSAVAVRRPDMEAGSSEVGLEDLVPGTDGPARDDAVDHERITGNELLGRLPAREDRHGVTVHRLVHGAGHEQQAAAVELVQSCDVRRTVLVGQRQEVLDGAVGQHVLHAGHRGGPRQGGGLRISCDFLDTAVRTLVHSRPCRGKPGTGSSQEPPSWTPPSWTPPSWTPPSPRTPPPPTSGRRRRSSCATSRTSTTP